MSRPFPISAEEWRALPKQEKVALVQSVWEGAGSARGIAAAIGPDISRNAVIGVYERNPELARTHPLGPTARSLSKRAYAKKAKTVKPPKKNAAPGVRLPPPVLPEVIEPPVFRRLPLEALSRNECKWPSGDPKEPGFGFCAAATDGSPYCAYHSRVAYNVREKKKAAQ